MHTPTTKVTIQLDKKSLSLLNNKCQSNDSNVGWFVEDKSSNVGWYTESGQSVGWYTENSK